MHVRYGPPKSQTEKSIKQDRAKLHRKFGPHDSLIPRASASSRSLYAFETCETSHGSLYLKRGTSHEFQVPVPTLVHLAMCLAQLPKLRRRCMIVENIQRKMIMVPPGSVAFPSFLSGKLKAAESSTPMDPFATPSRGAISHFGGPSRPY